MGSSVINWPPQWSYDEWRKFPIRNPETEKCPNCAGSWWGTVNPGARFRFVRYCSTCNSRFRTPGNFDMGGAEMGWIVTNGNPFEDALTAFNSGSLANLHSTRFYARLEGNVFQIQASDSPPDGFWTFVYQQEI